MLRLPRPFSLLPLVVAAVAAPGVARAQTAPAGDVAAAEALFEAGRSAAEKGDYAAACPRFRESERLDPAPGTLLNLADCEEHLGELASAWEVWKEALATLPPGDARLPAARDRAQAIEARVPRLTLSRAPGAPADMVVRKDDVEIHAASFGVPLPVDPGAHTIVVSAAGHEPRTTTLTLKEGESRTFPAEPGPLAPAAPSPAEAQAPAGPAPPVEPPPAGAHAASSPLPWRTIGFVSGGVGLAGIAIGSAFGVLALGDKSTVGSSCFGAKGCTQAGVDASNAGRTSAIASDVSFAVGGVLLASGVVLVLTHGPQKTGLTATPLVLARGSGVALGGSF